MISTLKFKVRTKVWPVLILQINQKGKTFSFNQYLRR